MSTKFIQTSVASINKNNAGEMLRRMGEHCIKQAYANNSEDTQYALDNLAQWARLPFATWLRARGVDIQQPATGSARFTVNGVKNPKRQSKAIEEAKTEPVLVTEHRVKQVKVEKPLEGLAADRGHDAMVKLLKALRKTDPDAAAFINDVWATKVEAVLGEQIAEYVPKMLKAA